MKTKEPELMASIAALGSALAIGAVVGGTALVRLAYARFLYHYGRAVQAAFCAPRGRRNSFYRYSLEHDHRMCTLLREVVRRLRRLGFSVPPASVRILAQKYLILNPRRGLFLNAAARARMYLPRPESSRQQWTGRILVADTHRAAPAHLLLALLTHEVGHTMLLRDKELVHPHLRPFRTWTKLWPNDWDEKVCDALIVWAYGAKRYREAVQELDLLEYPEMHEMTRRIGEYRRQAARRVRRAMRRMKCGS